MIRYLRAAPKKRIVAESPPPSQRGLDVEFFGGILRRMAPPDVLVLKRLKTLLGGEVDSTVAVEGGYTPVTVATLFARMLVTLLEKDGLVELAVVA